jgi:hypothetical protein
LETGKLGDLAGFSSAIVLAMIALLIGYEAGAHVIVAMRRTVRMLMFFCLVMSVIVTGTPVSVTMIVSSSTEQEDTCTVDHQSQECNRDRLIEADRNRPNETRYRG